ncbi:MAG: hypothetical protein ACFFBD_14290 [Candidatus Hodarchaeota archaeon]
MILLSKLSDYFHAWAKGWLILAIFAAIMLLLSVPPLIMPDFYTAIGNMVHLDGMFFYTPEESFSAVESYGEIGRVQMIWLHLTWDCIFPILYTLFFSLLISWLFQRSFKPESQLQKLNLVPIVGGIFDLMENTWIVSMILVYPARPTVVAWLSTLSTMSKWIMSIPIVLLVLTGLVKSIMSKLKVQEEEMNRD